MAPAASSRAAGGVHPIAPPATRRMSEKAAGISPQRPLPQGRCNVFRFEAEAIGPAGGSEVVLFADTFNRAYERENLDAALRVLVAGGYRVHIPKPADGGRPLCCGRTFLSAGLVDHARSELDRLGTTHAPVAARRGPILGLGPSWPFTLPDQQPLRRSDAAAERLNTE